MGLIRQKRLRTARRLRWLVAGAVAFQAGGCISDNVLANLVGQNLTQTFTVGVQSLESLVFGLPDTILNLLAFNALTKSGT